MAVKFNAWPNCIMDYATCVYNLYLAQQTNVNLYLVNLYLQSKQVYSLSHLFWTMKLCI